MAHNRYPPPPVAFVNGTVQWDLSPIGTLAADTTYSVEFDVWPTQDAYDLIADLNNGIITYDPNNPQHQQIEKITEGGVITYYLKTNTGLTISYKKGNDVYTDKPVQFDVPPIELTSGKIKLKKNWDNDVDTHTEPSIKVNLKKDNLSTYYFNSPKELYPGNNWETEDIYIAPGIIIVANGTTRSQRIRSRLFNGRAARSSGRRSLLMGA